VNLQELIDNYITYRRALGENFGKNANILRAFCRAIGTGAAVADVRPEQVRAFLNREGPVTRKLA